MSTRLFGFIELTLTFGGVLLFAVYQLVSVRRQMRARDRDKPADGAHDETRNGRRGIR